MVKSGSVPETLSQTLLREGQKLSQAQRLVQKTPVTALQLHDIDRIVNPVLLSPGSVVGVLTDANGQAALNVASSRPHWQVKGWVPDTKSFLNLQSRQISAPNLEFDKMPVRQMNGTTKSPQAILAVAWAHRILSENQYNAAALVMAVRQMLELLPQHGQLIIQDFALPENPDDFVILDLQDAEAVQALQEFSQLARPHAPEALRGFFIETLPAPRANVTRFRLPVKWAVEFYHRWRHGIAVDAPFELTTLSLEQWNALIEQCGARVNYRAPHFVHRTDNREIARVLRFSDENGKALPLPAASFTLVVEKLPPASAINYYERRISGDKARDIHITGIKSVETDQNFDVVEIRHHEDDILPWYMDADHELHVLIRTNVPRPIINAVPRGTPNLDGRHWAGYLIEPLCVPHMGGDIDSDVIHDTLRELLPVPVTAMGKVQSLVEYYPAPDYLVQRVRGMAMPIEAPVRIAALPARDTEGGYVIDVLATDVLHAISSGLIPDGKLEILIGKLMAELGVEVPVPMLPKQQDYILRATKFTKDRREAKLRRSVKMAENMMEYIEDNPTENLRAVRSVFVEDQMTEYGRNIGGYAEQDFIVSNKLSANTAVCIPMSRDPMGRMLIAAEPRRLPIPQRMGSGEPLMHLPSFSLPGTVTTMEEARQFMAKQMECDADDLYLLGPSFFVQPQISAERVYPFLLFAPPQATTWVRWYKPRSRLQRLVDVHVEKTTAYVEFHATRLLGEWYQGFGPELTRQITAPQKPGASDMDRAHILKRHPASKPEIG